MQPVNFASYNFIIDPQEFDEVVRRCEKDVSSLINGNPNELASIILPCLDLTTLNDIDSSDHVLDFCTKALQWQMRGFKVASVCVFPSWVSLAANTLKNSGIPVASVSGAFPTGQTSHDVKVFEVGNVLDNNADEVDFVINRGLFISGDYGAVFKEIGAAKELCVLRNASGCDAKDIKLKVILETGQLSTPQRIYDAAMLAMTAGADYVKTSTGKSSVGATPEAVFVMCKAIISYYESTQKKVGLKVSGGVSTVRDALFYYFMAKNLLPYEIIDREVFRIGSSKLIDILSRQIVENCCLV